MDSVRNLLAGANHEELAALAKILDCSPNTEAAIASLQKHSTHAFKRWFGEKPTYHQVLERVADHVGVSSAGLERELEARITEKLWTDIWNRLTPTQREELTRKLQEEAGRAGVKGAKTIAIGGAGLLAANLGGFATYMMASTVVGALTGILGLTLPFGLYMGLSSAISVLLGPVGWVGLGLFAIWRLGQPNMKKVTPAVVMLHTIRARQEMERTETRPSAAWKVIASLSAVVIVIVLGFVLVGSKNTAPAAAANIEPSPTVEAHRLSVVVPDAPKIPPAAEPAPELVTEIDSYAKEHLGNSRKFVLIDGSGWRESTSSEPQADPSTLSAQVWIRDSRPVLAVYSGADAAGSGSRTLSVYYKRDGQVLESIEILRDSTGAEISSWSSRDVSDGLPAKLERSFPELRSLLPAVPGEVGNYPPESSVR